MYSELVLFHFSQPYHRGLPESYDVLGQSGIPGAGPYLQIAISLGGDCIREAWFDTYGCPAAVACGSWLTQWIEGKPLMTVCKIEAHDLMLLLGGLPLGKEHCSVLAVEALQSAIKHASAGLSK